jgi:hypothetical protein
LLFGLRQVSRTASVMGKFGFASFGGIGRVAKQASGGFAYGADRAGP